MTPIRGFFPVLKARALSGVRGRLRLLRPFAGVILLLEALTLHATHAGIKFFDIPAGSADRSLKVFAAQSGLDVLYMTESVENIRTHALQGEYTPRQAINRLLVGTDLVVSENSRTGAMKIRRAGELRESEEDQPVDAEKGRLSQETPLRPPERAQPSPESGPPGIFPNTMDKNTEKTTKRRKPIALFSALLALIGPSPKAALADVPSQAVSTGVIEGRVRHAATGLYLNNTRISLRQTDLLTFTDETGRYRLTNVPSGPVVLEVFYTGLDPQQFSLEVAPGGVTQQDVTLTSADRYGRIGESVNLDPYTVLSSKDIEGEALATNEQRFAANIKNVIATDALGDIMDDNVGEFLKFLPGLAAEYSGDEIVGIGARGFGGAMTNFTVDGASSASASTNASRSVWLLGLALSNTSRVEVTKVPTPSTPADSLAGSVNMVSKSAFERDGASLRYGVHLVGNSARLDLKKSAHPFGDTRIWSIQPGANFDYTLPINKNLGIVLYGMYSGDKYNPQSLSTTTYTNAGTATNASVSAPFLQTHALQDGPRTQLRRSTGIKLDWRVTPNSVLSFGFQSADYRIRIASTSWTANTGNNGTPTVSTGAGFSYGDDYTNGATGRGSVAFSHGYQSVTGIAISPNLNYRFDNGTWKIETGINLSDSRRYRRNFKNGHFGGAAVSMRTPVRVSFADITTDRPGSTRVFNNSNQEVDIYDIESYQLTTGDDSYYTNRAGYKSGNLNVRRRLDVFPFPAAVQIGGFRSAQMRDTNRYQAMYTFNGPDGNPATADSLAPYAMTVYKNQDNGFGYRNIPFVSMHRLYEAWQANPNLFSQTPTQTVTEESYRISNSEWFEETVSALYFQLEARLFANRLLLLTGVRYEKTETEGQGPLYDPNAVWQRDANGNFVRNANGLRIRRTDAGMAGSMEELRLIRQERAYRAERSYDGHYPSFHATYNLRENLLIRAAYAKTYGRPDLPEIIPNTTVNEADLSEEEQANPDAVLGTITIRNTGLRPWSADNYDLSVEHYSTAGGVLSAGVFLKEVKDFFGSINTLATAELLEEVGLSQEYLGWRVSTKINSGDARVSGVEFNLRQPLRPLGTWARNILVFANATKLRLEGEREADFSNFLEESANWGFTFKRNRFTLTGRWNYRGLQALTAATAFGADGRNYVKARTRMDLNIAYQLTHRLRITASINNVFNVPQTYLRYGSATPDYARQFSIRDYGTAFAVGLKGTF